MDQLLAVSLPFASVLLGGWITYVANVRQRRQTKIEDVFHDAITAVAVAAAGTDYMSGIGPWKGATDEDVTQFMSALGREASANHARAVGEARASIALASAYDESLRVYLVEFDATYRRADEIMAHLRRSIDQRSKIKH